MRIIALASLAFFAGAILLFAELRWFNRRTLADRIAPYTPGGLGRTPRSGILSVESFREVVAPLSRSLGATGARLFGVSEELAVRLRRVHSELDVTAFRVRQLGWSLAAFAAAALFSVAASVPVPVAVVFVVGLPILAFLIQEQQLAFASERRQRRILLELPVVAEQLGMLLSSGYSLGSALIRISDRSNGACAQDLKIVMTRVRQGLTEIQALREWAQLADVDALDRLVAVLALNQQAGDLGNLISEEARSIRRGVHREQLETIERRSQQVWIPVTVAALVPGVIFIAVPFADAVSFFTG